MLGDSCVGILIISGIDYRKIVKFYDLRKDLRSFFTQTGTKWFEDTSIDRANRYSFSYAINSEQSIVVRGKSSCVAVEILWYCVRQLC